VKNGGDELGSSITCSVPWDNLDDESPRVSDEFSWAGAKWQLLFFPSGYGSETQGHSSVYLRLLSDGRPRPLPRGISFSVTTTGGSKDALVASRACSGHIFSLESSAKRSWGFAKFAEKSTLEQIASSSSVSSPPALTLQVHLGPASSSACGSGNSDAFAGLVNNGNTCYMNALLQSLYHVSAFREGLLSSVERGLASGKLGRSNNAAVELAKTFASMKSSSSSASSFSGRSGEGGIAAEAETPAPAPASGNKSGDSGGGQGGGGFSWPWSGRLKRRRQQMEDEGAQQRAGLSPGRTLGLCRALGIDPRQQEDAQEFRGNLFLALSEALETVSSEESSLDDDLDEDGDVVMSHDDKVDSKNTKKKPKKKKAESAMAALETPFQGRLVNEIRSGVPGIAFAKTWSEPFADLAVDITSTTSSTATLVGALEAYFSEEVMSGSNAYKAKGHGLLAKAFKGCRLDGGSPIGKTSAAGGLPGLPEVLHVQLKRFAFDSRTMRLSKVHAPCRFDQDLDLAPFVTAASTTGQGTPVETRYKLHAVLVHSGDANFGHYYAYIKPSLASEVASSGKLTKSGSSGGGWFKFDDQRVTPVPIEVVLAEGAGVSAKAGSGTVHGTGGSFALQTMSTNAYLLQYVRVDAIQALLHDGES